MKVFEELRQRKVLKTAALYFAVAWGATEILSYLIERIPVFPAWADTAIAILFVLGFPVTVFLAWMFDVDKHGVRRADPSSGLGRGVIFLSLTGLLLATGAFSYFLLPNIENERDFSGTGDLGTVAVLPFENLTGDPSLGYLGLGLAEDVRQRLLAQTDLEIIGRVSIAGFAGTATDLASLRGLLNAGLVLEGNLQKVAGRLQVSIALLDTETGKQVWGSLFAADRADWDRLRQQIVSSLAEQMALTVRVRENETPVPAEALEAYLRGLSELNHPEVADSWFEEAVRLAPEFADAWARRGLLRVEMIWRGKALQQAWDEAELMFTRAREIEPDNLLADIAEAHMLWLANLDAVGSYEVIKRAEARAPNHPLVLAGLTTSSGFIPGNEEQALVYGRRYVALDPLSADAHNRLGLAFSFNKKLDEAFQENQRAIELNPNFTRAWDYRINWQFYHNYQAEALVTATRKAALENPVREDTVRCMLYIASLLLPIDRAVPLMEDAIRRELGMGEGHWWCENPLEALVFRLEHAGMNAEAEAAKARLMEWQAKREIAYTNDDFQLKRTADESVECEDNLCRIRLAIGEEAFAQWLGPEPPLQYFNFGLAGQISRALKESGRIEESRRLASLVAPVVRDFAGPGGYPTSTAHVVDLLALSGDIEGALDYAEQVGPDAFYRFGTVMTDHPELKDEPRWIAFQERGQARLREEVEEFDRLVASGDIVMP